MQDLSTDIRIIEMYKAAQPSGSGPFSTSIVETNLNDSFVIVCSSGPEGTSLSTVNYLSFRLQHSDTGIASDFTPVTQEDIVNGYIGPNGQFWALDGNPTGFEGRGGNPGTVGLSFSVGYVGDKKFFRVVITVEGTLASLPVLNICCFASKTRYFQYNDQFSHSTEDDWRIYSEGTATLSGGGKVISGRDTLWKEFVSKGDKFSDNGVDPNYYTISRIDGNTSLLVEEDIQNYITYSDGSITDVGIGDTALTFTGTNFVAAWNDYVQGPRLSATVAGVMTDFGSCTIDTTTQITLDTGAPSVIAAGADYEIKAGNPLSGIEYTIYKKQWA